MRSDISTPAKRRKLTVSKAPVWEAIGGARAGCKLGYRRGIRGGSWVAKLVDNGHRVETTLGAADDDASAPRALSYSSAIAAALAWTAHARQRIADGGKAAPDARSLTVGDAVRTYIQHRLARNRVTGRDAKSRLGLHALGDARFPSIPLAKLTADDIARWRRGLPKALRPATINRTLNDLRAALRAAADQNWRDLPRTLGKEIELGLRSLPSAEAARHALLSDDDMRRAINAAYDVDPDLGALVLVLAATGARFSQAAKMAVMDLQADAERIMVPVSTKGRGSKSRTRIAVPVGSDVVERLRPLIEGRAGHEPLLMHWVRKQVSPMAWACVARAAWDTASHMQRGWRKALRIAGLTHVEAYSLRHSSIVRMLREGLPVRVVAGLHDTSTVMIERHYSAYILDMADELARRAITLLVAAPRRALPAVERRP
jgi:integrase